jgi:hypothetical protein
VVEPSPLRRLVRVRNKKTPCSIRLTKIVIFDKIELQHFPGYIMRCLSSKMLFFLCLLFPIPSFAQNHIGFILEGYQGSCEVLHKAKSYGCEERRELFVGDVVTKKPSVKQLKIKWAPYAKGIAKGESTIEVVFDRPERFKGGAYTAVLKQYIDDFLKPTEHVTAAAVARDPKARQDTPLRATLLKSIPMKLANQTDEARSLLIFDHQKKRVYEKRFHGKEPLLLNGNQMKLRPQEQYTVFLNSPSAQKKIVVAMLEGNIEDEVLEGLTVLDREGGTDSERLIKKSAYLQLISDTYPEKFDLYWLSYQLISDAHQVTKEQGEAVAALKSRYYSHITNSE